jgi:hypothetical protein
VSKLTAAALPASPRARLKTMSRWMRALIAAGAVAIVLATGWVWLGDDGLIEQRMRELAGAPIPNEGVLLPAAVKATLFLLSAPSALIGLFMLWQAWQLFGAYGRGQVFGEPASTPVRRLAWALVLAAVLRPLSNTLSVLLLTWHNPPGQRQLVFSISWEDYLCVMFGGLLIAMAWAMTEASRIEQDNAGFI